MKEIKAVTKSISTIYEMESKWNKDGKISNIRHRSNLEDIWSCLQV